MNADRLREAARVLRERAEAATPGPWIAFRADGTWVGVTTDISPTEESKAGDVWADPKASAPDAKCIATMHPGVALALADWLDACGDFMADYPAYRHDGEDYAARIAGLILEATS